MAGRSAASEDEQQVWAGRVVARRAARGNSTWHVAGSLGSKLHFGTAEQHAVSAWSVRRLPPWCHVWQAHAAKVRSPPFLWLLAHRRARPKIDSEAARRDGRM